MATTVVNIKVEECDIYIGRHQDPLIGKWGNPYTTKNNSLGKFKVATKKEALLRYKEYVLSTPELFNSLIELKDKKLGCFCKPNDCHGDILVELIRQIENGIDF